MRPLLFLLALLLASPSLAAITVMSTTGSDANACGAGAGSPKRFLAGSSGCAACLDAPGDVCQMEGGATAATALVYTERLDGSTTALTNGTAGSRMTIRVTPGEYVLIRPSSGCSIFAFAGPDYWTIDGAGTETPPAHNHLILDGRNLGCGAASAAIVDLGGIGSSFITLKNLTMRDASNSGTASSYSAMVRADDSTFSNIEFNGTHQVFGDYQGTYHFYAGQHGADRLIIEDSLVHDAGGLGIQINNSHADNVGTGHILRRNKVYNNGRGSSGERGGIAITTYQAQALIHSNWIYNNNGNGLNLYGAPPGGNHQVYNNTLYGNTSSGIQSSTWANSENLLIKNNVIKNNGGAGIRVFPYARNTIIDTNSLHGNGSGNAVVVDSGATATVSNTLTSDPQLNNPSAGNFYLKSTSPLIGVGLNLTSVGVTTDIDGNPRTVPFDLGGAESGQTTPNVLVFTQPPTNALVDATIVPPVVVCSQVNGVTQTTFTNSISLVHTVGTGTLTGGTGGTPTSGCRTFSGLSFNITGSKTLRADATGATSATATVTITAAPVPTVSSFVLTQPGIMRLP